MTNHEPGPVAPPRRCVSVIGLRGLKAIGGVETVARELYPWLQQRGWDVTVYVRPRYAEAGEEPGLQIRRIPTLYTKHLEAFVHTGLCTLDAVARRAPLIHYHTVGNALWLWLPRVFGIPTVVTVHGLDWERGKWGGFASLMLRVGSRLAAALADEVIGVSKPVAQHFDTALGRSIHYVPNGIPSAQPPADSRSLSEMGVSRPFVLFLGRWVPEKGVTTLLEAFRRTEGDAQLVVAGGGTHTGSYERAIRDLASRDSRVVLVGPRFGAEKTALLRSAKAFVLPSSLEGMPIALLEAMDQGTPCIVSDIPENLEVVRSEQETTSLVFRCDDVDDLARQLSRALKQDLVEIGLAGQRHARERFNWDRIAAETERILQGALS